MAYILPDTNQGVTIKIQSTNSVAPMDPFPTPLKLTYTDPPTVILPDARPTSGQMWPRGLKVG